MSGEIRNDRLLEIFYRALKGEALSAVKLAEKYKVSTRSVSRDITTLKLFLADHRDMVGNTELVYSSTDHCYKLQMDSFITNKELFFITKILVGVKALGRSDLLPLINKLKANTSSGVRDALANLLRKELYHYSSINFDCQSILDNVWEVSECIEAKHLVTITYYRMDRKEVKHKLKPVAIMFAEYYFYLLAYKYDEPSGVPYYFRIDRIVSMVRHREKYVLAENEDLDEGLLRQRSQFMWPGKLRRIRFAFTGPSVQAILDRLPTAKIVDAMDNKYIIEAEVYGQGIKMYLLSQGAWVQVLEPEEFVEEMREEVEKMRKMYEGM